MLTVVMLTAYELHIKILNIRVYQDNVPFSTVITSRLNKLHTWDISEGFGDTGVLVVDDAWSSALDPSAIPHLTLTSTHALRGVDLKAELFVLIQYTIKRHKKQSNISHRGKFVILG